jgi:hypothetical protein
VFNTTSGMLVPTGYSIDQGAGSDLSISFAVTSRLLPPKEHKINNRTFNIFKKNGTLGRLYDERNFL